ncbi:hypothetical protein [Halorubrum ezzemoulense]|uniref:hypothetical protein n=1 Tax=Halorubrum ezzemoulense TaxID=337243 RepID=UPI00232D83A1|nr:hypothetical protein [Halorubrum ezzemoulense]MDB9273828.1 hypothetical protein [Halorubrum ezzemoulense]MDB9294398.1 hypothetical protein [Halorubrum ezzemoulense]
MGVHGDRSDRSGGLGRRTFVKGIGASIVGAAGLASTTKHAAAVDWGFVGTAAASTVVGGPVALGWALREFEVIGADSPPEGLTPDALKQSAYEAWTKRKSNDKSTFVDNRNVVTGGVENAAYTEGKTAAIEAINNGASNTDVQSAAVSAINAYEETILGNLVKSWNEMAKEWVSFYDRADAHSSVTPGDFLSAAHSGSDYPISNAGLVGGVSKTLPEGVTMDGLTYSYTNTGGSVTDDIVVTLTPLNVYLERGTTQLHTSESDLTSGINEGSTFPASLKVKYNGNVAEWPLVEKWSNVFQTVTSAFTSARDGIILWIDEATTQLNEGDIDTSDLITPRDRANMMGDGESNSQAISDLIALNASVDPEREATITIDDTGARLTGTFAITDPNDGPLEAGKSYDPANLNGDVFFTTDLSLIEGTFEAHAPSLDNGLVTLTSEPYENTRLNVTTSANESVEVDAGNFTSTGSGNWTYNASDDLSNPSASVYDVSFFSTATETQYQTIRLEGSFTVESFTNTETGESVNSTSFTRSDPQTDTNYLTQEDWDQLEQQNKELIEKYEQSQSGGGLDLGQFDMFGLPGEIVALGAAAVIGFLTLNN